jgi:hypothetical protein
MREPAVHDTLAHAGVALAAVLGRLLPGDWSPGAFAAVGVAAAVAAGAAGGLAGAWQGPPGAAILGPPLGAVLLIALQPQADLVTLLSLLAVLAVLAGAAVTAVAFSGRSRGLHRHG